MSMMKIPLYRQVIGTGGIGGGILFELEGDRALSRNETRMACLSPAKDYCKIHIILHYIARVLSPEVSVYAIGAVGQDQMGAQLTGMMKQAGIDTAFVRSTDERPTMYAVCLQYPDKSVCNVTTAQSAGSLVSESDIADAIKNLPKLVDEGTIAIAVPEVPVKARLTLLKLSKKAGAFCVTSFLSDEAQAFTEGGGLLDTDLLVVNEDEAAAFCGVSETDPLQQTRVCYEKLRLINPTTLLAVTFGAMGSFVCGGGDIQHIPAYPVNVVATGGAGDAFIAGTVCGIALGLPFFSDSGVSAARLGSRFAAESVTVMDTIARHIDRELAFRIIDEMRDGSD